MADRRRTFVPVVLVGIASAGLTAVAGHQPWGHVTGSQISASSTLTLGAEAGRVPGCTGFALLLLACWGVVLVTRGRVRRLVAGLGLLAALGAATAAVLGFAHAPDDVRAAFAQFGLTDVQVGRSVWSFLVFPLVLVAVGTAAAAVALARSWPEMGRRYDAPASAAPRVAVPVGEEQDDIGVWKALNEGRDPTTGPPP